MTTADNIRTWLDTLIPAASPFVLRRHHDVTGVSGTGIVADGVVFPAAGKSVTVLRWRGDRGSTVVWDNVGHAKEIHGHDGNTVIELVPVDDLVKALKAVMAIVPASRARYGDTEAVDGWNDALGEVHAAIHDAVEQLAHPDSDD
ncbi:hypothetical protein ACFYRN_45175 [Streptomyces sp. NPDC005227]|uniref:hypothetical protein n=1 Tax=Streptomyces sp. NPDC005227 TaxID=3364707 RepID=UPI0036988C6A